MDEGVEIVVFHDGGRDVFDRDVHVFIAVHWHVEVEILDVDGHKMHIGGREDTVEKDFDGRQFSSGGAHFAAIVNTVATNGEMDATGLHLVGLIIGNNTEVGSLTLGQKGGNRNEMHSVGANGDVGRKTLGKTANFVFSSL